MANNSQLNDLLRDYWGSSELELFLSQFVDWLRDQDIVLATPVYETYEFDISTWVQSAYPGQKLDYRSEPCPECKGTYFLVLENDYMCIACRAVWDLTEYNTISLQREGLCPEGFRIWYEPDEGLLTRRPCGDYDSIQDSIQGPESVTNLAYYFLRYQIDRLPPKQEQPQPIICRTNAIPF